MGFKVAVAKTYDRYSGAAGGTGVPSAQLLEAIRHFFYKRAPADIRNVVPNPDDELSTAAVIYLVMTYVLRGKRSQTSYVKHAFSEALKSICEASLVLKK